MLSSLWKGRAPAFCVSIFTFAPKDPNGSENRDSWGFGNGLLVDAESVVTCAHVVWLGGVAGFDNWPEIARVWSEGPWSIKVGRSSPRVLVKKLHVHSKLDLALLKLERPWPGVRAPLGGVARRVAGAPSLIPRWEPGHGLSAVPNCVMIDEMSVEYRTGYDREEGLKIRIGAVKGTSGSGLFTFEEGRLAFVGIVSRGGRDVGTGWVESAESVLGFLNECNVARPSPPPEDPFDLALWLEGLAPDPIDLDDGLGGTMRFAPLPADPGAGHSIPVWIATKPVRASLYAWLADDAECIRTNGAARGMSFGAAEAAAAAFPAPPGFEIRLPFETELRVAFGDPPRAPGEVLRRFGIEVPIPGTGEWIADHVAITCWHNPPGVSFDASPDRGPSRNLGFRLALTLADG